MGLREFFGGDKPQEERLLLALERIAIALEQISGLSRPTSELENDESTVLYTDEIADLEKEVRREGYRLRTGQALAEGEDVPRLAGASWPRKLEGKATLSSDDQLWFEPEGDPQEAAGHGFGQK